MLKVEFRDDDLKFEKSKQYTAIVKTSWTTIRKPIDYTATLTTTTLTWN